MNTKKIRRKIEKELDRDSFMRFAKEKNPRLYKSEFNKLFNREMKNLRQKKIGQKEAEKQMDFMEAESRFKHINDPWLRKHLAYKSLQKNKKQSPKNKNFYL
jgi:hypothetical protein